MTNREPQGAGGGVTAPVAVALTLVAFFALVIMALGLATLITGDAVIETPGLGVLPGVAGVAAAVIVYGLITFLALRPAHPSYVTAVWAALGCYLAYVLAVWLAAVVGGVDAAAAANVAGRLAIGWWAPLVALAAFACAWSAVALRRTHARRPRWPWEGGT